MLDVGCASVFRLSQKESSGGVGMLAWGLATLACYIKLLAFFNSANLIDQ